MLNNRMLWLSLLMAIVVAANLDAQERRRRQAPAGKEPPHPPAVGEEVPGFELPKINAQDEDPTDGEVPTTKLEDLTKDHDVVLLVLRGWPGYQCPICSRQVGQFITKADQLTEHGVEVVMIYPGPADLLAAHAKEFQGDKTFPDNYHYLTDPDYKFTNAWGLRWEAPRETAYPSTFIIGKDGLLKFGHTSTTHGDRVNVETVVKELEKLKDES